MNTNLPLGRYNVFSSTDLDVVRDYVSGIFSRHQLSLTDRAAQINTRLHYMKMTNLAFVYLDYGAPVSIQPGCLEDFYLLQMVLRGSASVSYDDNTYISNTGEATLINPTKPVKITSCAKCQFLSIRLNKNLINQQLAIALHDTPEVPLDFESNMNFRSTNGQAIRHYIKFLIDEIDLLCSQPDPIATYEYFEKTLASMLIEMHPHNYSAQLHNRKSVQLKPYVKKADQFMQENLEQTISLEDLAQAAQITPRTLSNAFQRCYGMSPMHYLKVLRLDRARHLLDVASPDTNITSIAMDSGIKHLGRFSKEYKDRYGETPSQTLGKKTGLFKR